MRRLLTAAAAGAAALGLLGPVTAAHSAPAKAPAQARAQAQAPAAVGQYIWNLHANGEFCLTPKGNGKANGTIVTLWTCTDTAPQRWHRDSRDRLVNDASGKCLTPQGNAYNTNGAVLTLWTCGTNDSQEWSSKTRTLLHAHSFKAITPKGGSVANGVYATLWTNNAYSYQTWGLTGR
ncbi:hypothetical protein GCM10010329_02980 [Streptomyces spiroverticillatus]|uniref:Ricin B lectin domain-containing protein n=1 Tax=Streptomyces finlayi TaxID=67296 RepID=A0A918WSG0_9ACTN|nr:RICIN domain-containing protein [Streptomyces finlayi]GGZ86536.1 hypothetical protein GCM10010329_02980 [Streptomyces spiroverticillatus]GHC78056.1 hypothetical protein GCM10010334_02960 [Streptomyces finlayi]